LGVVEWLRMPGSRLPYGYDLVADWVRGSFVDKSTRQILIEYLTSESEDEWLGDELADFFVDDSIDAEDEVSREEITQAAMDRAVAGAESLIASKIDECELVSFCVSIICGDCGEANTTFFRAVPGPEALLMYCVKAAKPTDKVVVVYTFIDGIQLAFDGVWPFGMDTAVELSTVPDLDTLAAADSQGDLSSVTRAVANVADLGLGYLQRGVSASLSALGVQDDPVRAAGVGVVCTAVVAALLGRGRRRGVR
jgi:hypothetical protein